MAQWSMHTHGAGLDDVLDRLVFEVTERGVPGAIGAAAIERDRVVGMRFARSMLFGVSNADLAALSRGNADIIKLSKSFVDSHPYCRDDLTWGKGDPPPCGPPHSI